MYKLLTAIVMALGLLSSVSKAELSVDQWKQKADAYRDSGQLATADEARQAREYRSEIPLKNRNYMQNIREFIHNTGGWVRKPRVAYDADGLIQTVEFESKDLSCRITDNRGLCIDTKTLHQYNCMVGYFWAIACSAAE